MGDFVQSREYDSFRSSIPQKKIVVDGDEDRTWVVYDAGPRNIRCPLVFLPPASGRATVFYKQLLTLSAAGYRVIALDYPVYWNMKQWNEGFCKLIDYLRLDKIHIFGASLGGYLGQKFAESTYLAQRVQSLILCNSFSDTSIFQQSNSAPAYWMLPGVLLKKMIMGNFERGRVDKAIVASIDFMVDSLDSLGQQELASRLTLNCMNSYVEAHKLGSMPVTIIDVLDASALSVSVKDDMFKCYPSARRAHLKNGGNFPYLSRAEEVNVYIQIHLKNFWGSKESALSSDREMEMLYTKSTESEDSPSS